jgi:hypothetical protein
VTENEKLRALLAEAREALVRAENRMMSPPHQVPEAIARIDAALAEPVAPKRIDAHDALYQRICEDREFWQNYERERDDLAYQRGAEAMREAAALAVHADFTAGQSAVDAVTRAVRLIRALPIPEDKR